MAAVDGAGAMVCYGKPCLKRRKVSRLGEILRGIPGATRDNLGASSLVRCENPEPLMGRPAKEIFNGQIVAYRGYLRQTELDQGNILKTSEMHTGRKVICCFRHSVGLSSILSGAKTWAAYRVAHTDRRN